MQQMLKFKISFSKIFKISQRSISSKPLDQNNKKILELSTTRQHQVFQSDSSKAQNLNFVLVDQKLSPHCQLAAGLKSNQKKDPMLGKSQMTPFQAILDPRKKISLFE
jgi:hypothetical protein